MSKKDYHLGFWFGFQQLTDLNRAATKEQLKQALRITTRVQFDSYRCGKTECKISQVLAIEKVFKNIGITEIWGAKKETKI